MGRTLASNRASRSGGVPIRSIGSNNSLLISGANKNVSFASIPHDFAANVQGAFGFWYKPLEHASGDRKIWGDGTDRFDIEVQAATGKLYCWFKSPTNGSGALVGITSKDYIDGNWHFIAVSKTATRITFYVDAVEINHLDTTEMCNAYTALRYGMSSTTPAAGFIKEVMIWSTGLTAQEVADLYDLGIIPQSAALVARHKLDEGSGTTAHDTQGSFDGTLNNSPAWSTDVPLGARTAA